MMMGLQCVAMGRDGCIRVKLMSRDGCIRFARCRVTDALMSRDEWLLIARAISQ